MNREIILFAKAPDPGKVKTRMQPFLTPEQSAELATALVRDAAVLMRHTGAERRTIAFAPANGQEQFERLVGNDLAFTPQSEGDLGCRMHHQFLRSFEAEAGSVIIIGADSPALPHLWVDEAFNALAGVDLVLGPSYDGGYYLVGLRRPAENLFHSIEWSSKNVLSQTLDRAEQAGMSLYLLPPLADLDFPEDLKFLAVHLRAMELAGSDHLPKFTNEFLSTLGPALEQA